MELSKRTLILICLGWFVSIAIIGIVAGYYYLNFRRETKLNMEYVDSYNQIVKNYTNLLSNYQGLIEQYNLEKQNLTELLEEYGSCIMKVNIRIDYMEWNGTWVWYNDTVVPLGSDLLQATEIVADIKTAYWAAYQASFVEAINGVENQGAKYWMWQRWNKEEGIWDYGDLGADRHKLTNDEVVMWRYETSSYPYPNT